MVPNEVIEENKPVQDIGTIIKSMNNNHNCKQSFYFTISNFSIIISINHVNRRKQANASL